MKYYCISDIHSYYKAMDESLKEAGYNKFNTNDCLVILGDIFDRGPETAELLNFIRSIPKENRILIRGNHEYLLKTIVKKFYPESHDWSNGTVRTCIDLYLSRHPYSKFRKEIKQIALDRVGAYGYYIMQSDSQIYNFILRHALSLEWWNLIAKDIKKSGIIEWIFESVEWVNYFELDKYIFVHSFIPLKNIDGLPSWYINDRSLEYFKDWRKTATEQEWLDATWGCPYKQFDAEYFSQELETDKILVCGHWHAADFHKNYEHITARDDSAYVGKNLIALDACTVLSGFCNVMTIDEDLNIDFYPKFEDQIK